MEKKRIDTIRCYHPIGFYICWGIVFLWMILSICNDWGEGPYQFVLDLLGMIGFGALFVMMIISFGTAKGKKQLICDIYDGIDKNIMKMMVNELLLFLSSMVIGFQYLFPWDINQYDLASSNHRMVYEILGYLSIVFLGGALYYAIYCAKKISMLVLEKYSGRIITLGADVVLMVNLFLLLTIGGDIFFTRLLVVILVFHFLYTLIRIVRIAGKGQTICRKHKSEKH